MATKEQELYDAAKEGRVAEVQDLLKDNPGLNVNWSSTNDRSTALHMASITTMLKW